MGAAAVAQSVEAEARGEEEEATPAEAVGYRPGVGAVAAAWSAAASLPCPPCLRQSPRMSKWAAAGERKWKWARPLQAQSRAPARRRPRQWPRWSTSARAPAWLRRGASPKWRPGRTRAPRRRRMTPAAPHRKRRKPAAASGVATRRVEPAGRRAPTVRRPTASQERPRSAGKGFCDSWAATLSWVVWTFRAGSVWYNAARRPSRAGRRRLLPSSPSLVAGSEKLRPCATFEARSAPGWVRGPRSHGCKETSLVERI